MSYGMNDSESRGIIQFPAEATRAVDVPPTKMIFSPSDKLFTAKDGDIDYTKALNRESGPSFQKIRSLVIFSEVPVEIRGIYEDPAYASEGITMLQGIPETEEIEINYGWRYGEEDLEPEEVHTFVKAFNTPEIQMPNDDEKVSVSKDNSKTVSGTYERLMAMPTFIYNQARFKVFNDGDNEAEIRIYSYASGNKFPEEIDTDATPTTKTLGAGDYGTVNVEAPSEYVEIEGRGNTGDTTIRTEFVGEA